jgi:hypothetical protein
VLSGRRAYARGWLLSDGNGPRLRQRQGDRHRRDGLSPGVHAERSAGDGGLSGTSEPELVDAIGSERRKAGYGELAALPVGPDIQSRARPGRTGAHKLDDGSDRQPSQPPDLGDLPDPGEPLAQLDVPEEERADDECGRRPGHPAQETDAQRRGRPRPRCGLRW